MRVEFRAEGAHLLQPRDDRLRERGEKRRDDQNSRGTVVGPEARKPHRSVLPEILDDAKNGRDYLSRNSKYVIILCQTGKNSHDWILPKVTLPRRNGDQAAIPFPDFAPQSGLLDGVVTRVVGRGLPLLDGALVEGRDDAPAHP